MTYGRQPTWRNPQVLLTLSLVFLCGAAVGAFVYKVSSQKVSAKQVAAAWKSGSKESTLLHLKKELQLTPDQAAEIETVLDDFAMYYQMLQAQMDEVLSTGRDRINHVLDEKQRKKFSHMMDELKLKNTR